MKKYFKILKSCPLFADIAEDEMGAMLDCLGARVTSFGKKYTILAEGTAARHVGIVLSGSVQVIQNDWFGNRSIVGQMGEGEVFAEAFAAGGVESLPVSVIAAEDSEILLIECHRILHACCKVCSFHQRLIFNLMKDLAVKAVQFHQKLEITSKRTTREKLLAFLAQQQKKSGKAKFTIPFDRQDLADFLEVDRSGLSTEIGKLQREGMLRAVKREFELL
ncbi:MAG: Crp/Fnr family transcriptional regulator [Clostridia bacterium]|nr:Crp/Fnr family transcriptional regulator [Clostridia bacterium]